jgi:pyridoxal phosphate enzyme (YggS family)
MAEEPTEEQRGARRRELADGLAAVEERVLGACRAAGREREEVTVVVVTKTHPASDVRLLAGLGVRDVGEARVAEAATKHEACADLDLRWHAIGQVQTKKSGALARWADVVHSVDRDKLVHALERAAAAAGRELEVLLQVSLDGDPTRGGAVVDDVPALAETVAVATGLRLQGVMAVAPLGLDPADAFARLQEVSRRLRAEHPEAQMISAGMSADLEAAVAHGATHLRVGSAVLGSRPPLG